MDPISFAKAAAPFRVYAELNRKFRTFKEVAPTEEESREYLQMVHKLNTMNFKTDALGYFYEVSLTRARIQTKTLCDVLKLGQHQVFKEVVFQFRGHELYQSAYQLLEKTYHLRKAYVMAAEKGMITVEMREVLIKRGHLLSRMYSLLDHERLGPFWKHLWKLSHEKLQAAILACRPFLFKTDVGTFPYLARAVVHPVASLSKNTSAEVVRACEKIDRGELATDVELADILGSVLLL